MLNKLWVFDIFVFVNAMISNICMIKFNMTWKLGFPSNEFSASKLLYWKQSKWDQQKFLFVFSLKLCLFFCGNLLFRKKLMFDVWMDLKGFDVWMATILSHIQPRSTTRITIIGYLISQTFPWFTNVRWSWEVMWLNWLIFFYANKIFARQKNFFLLHVLFFCPNI